MISLIFVLLGIVAIAGIIKPFIPNTARWHYVIAFILFSVMSAAVAPEPTPEEQARTKIDQEEAEAIAIQEAAEKERDLNRASIARQARSIIVNSARNPDSIVFTFVGTNEDASIVCLEYRGQNGFGGMSKGAIAFINGVASDNNTVWNKNCANKELYEQSTDTYFM
jgi:hypothetical protein